MNLLVFGDSWGCGEWGDDPHPGVAGYLQESGHHVLNFSQPGSSNWQILMMIRQVLSSGLAKPDTAIIVFQTSWHRDLRYLRQGDQMWMPGPPLEIDVFHRFSHFDVLNPWYHALDVTCGRFAVQGYLVGGCSDTVNSADFDTTYAHLTIACQSLVRACVPQDSADPVYALDWPPDMVDWLWQHKQDTAAGACLMHQIELAERRQEIMCEHPEWFWPDGHHANRRAHKKLHDLLQIHLAKDG